MTRYKKDGSGFEWHNPQQCPECDKECASREHLKKHIHAKHPHINSISFETYRCIDCNGPAPFFVDGQHLCQSHAVERYPEIEVGEEESKKK